MGAARSEQRLADTFVELADAFADDLDAARALRRFADRCVQLLDVSAAGLMLAGPGGELRTAAASDERPALRELFDAQRMQGPCPDCFRTAAPVAPVDLGSAEACGRWPAYAELTRRAGYASTYAVPLRAHEDVLGVLQLLRTGPVPPGGADDARLAQALGAAAALGIRQQRALRRSEALAGQLQAALDSRVVLEQAKGVLAERWEVSVAEAFARLRRYARSRRERLSDVAQGVVEGTLAVPADGPPSGAASPGPRARRRPGPDADGARPDGANESLGTNGAGERSVTDGAGGRSVTVGKDETAGAAGSARAAGPAEPPGPGHGRVPG